MSIQRVFVASIVACLGLLASFDTPSAALAAEVVPQKQSLTIPITTAPPRSVECVVPFGPPICVSAVAFSPDGKKLAAAGYQEVVIWDLENAKLLKRVGSGQLGTTVGAVEFLKDARLLAAGEGTPHRSGAVRIFDIDSGQQTRAFEEPGDVVYCLAVSPDGKLLAAGGADGLAHVWSLDEKKLLTTIKDHGGWVLGVSFSRDGKRLATASADNSVGVWEVGTWKPVVKLPESETVHGAAFGADGITLALAVGGPSQWSVRLRRTDNLRYTRPFSTGAGMPLDVRWTPKNRIYVPSSDNIVRVFDGNGRLLASLTGHEDWVYCAAVSADETKVASGSADGTVKLWSTQDHRLLATLVQLAPRADQWLVLTEQGYFAASASNVLQWKTANVKTPPEQLTALLQKPESVQQALAGNKVKPPALE